MSKEYGLILPGKKKTVELPKSNFTKPSVFGSDSDSDEVPAMLPKMRPNPMGPGPTERRKARAIHEKALAENPTIFQYDELYDEIENKRQEEKTAKSNEIKKPKYIEHLLQHAERRKLENERRIERMVQKEREAEGEQFKDKESYVTAAYRKKLEELQKAEEQEKREDYLESIGDVTKQQDLGGFYRHLYEQKLGPKETKSEKTIELENTTDFVIPKVSKPRTYRKRQSSDDEKEPEVVLSNTAAKSHIQSNLDADSDFSIDSSSDSDDSENNKNNNEKTGKIIPEKKIKQEKIKSEPEKVVEEEEKVNINKESKDIDPGVRKNTSELKKETEKEDPKTPRIDIWKKRTVGAAFEEAVQKYYERKAARSSSRFQ